MLGGTVFATIPSVIAVFSQPQGRIRNRGLALWTGRAKELSLFDGPVDVKMCLYVVGGTMLSLNALSGAWYHYGLFGEDSNPGVFLYAAFFTFYVLDSFVFERVQLYTYDLIHEDLGFKSALGWSYRIWMALHPSVVGNGRLSESGIHGGMDVRLAHRNRCPVSVRMEHFSWS